MQRTPFGYVPTYLLPPALCRRISDRSNKILTWVEKGYDWSTVDLFVVNLNACSVICLFSSYNASDVGRHGLTAAQILMRTIRALMYYYCTMRKQPDHPCRPEERHVSLAVRSRFGQPRSFTKSPLTDALSARVAR